MRNWALRTKGNFLTWSVGTFFAGILFYLVWQFILAVILTCLLVYTVYLIRKEYQSGP